ncbi:hypothetical protein B795N_00790 [Marinilactibacillus psychrotolerans]|uniref:hypothetical protein n=1 Tax=Marinilactibacillus psychrotolerans TaxID=191770 RepID=UPI001C7E1BBB|nr:hypothetical protein [Marinilactibacillus psychrotolerans]GEQ32197.1 hypothetical protein B795N_00790 [Marinilactibacillus psychrotolerans]
MKHRVTRRLLKSRNNMQISLDFENYEEAKDFVENVCFNPEEDYTHLEDSNDFHEEFHGNKEIVSIDKT